MKNAKQVCNNLGNWKESFSISNDIYSFPFVISSMAINGFN